MQMIDIIKSSVYDSFMQSAGLSFWDICVVLVMACLMGIYISGLYKNTSKSSFYSKDLNITMAGVVVVTSGIMIAMQTNLIVSLGMVGALSIVRFRTAIKNPMDLLYLFWAICEGIICGVKLYVLGILLCIIMTILILLLGKIPNNKASELIIIRASSEKEPASIIEIVKNYCRYVKESSFIARNGEYEIIYEVRVQTHKRHELIGVLNNDEKITSVNWLEHKGEMRI